jgi:type I restriction enzyme S subunit
VGDTEWRECQLGDLLTLQRGFDLPYHARKPGRVPIVSSSGPSGFHSEAKCKAPGIVTGRYGTLGEVHFINEDYWPHNTALYVKDMKGNDPRFLYYLLGYTNLAHHNDKSGVPGVNRNDLHQIEVLRPPLPEQRSIARVLGGLDDKIELNRRMNRTLEELARGVFRSWFVDFDPVLRRVGAARTARGATPHTPHTPPPLHWPARLVDPPAGSALGPIPEGWKVSTIGEEVTVVGGSTPSTDEPKFWEGGTHCWVTPRDLSRLSDPVVIDSERRITDAGLTQISSGLMPRGTVLLSSRAPIGYLAIADVPVAVNQGFIGVKCDKGLPGVFVLRWCEENMEEVLSRAGGTTFAEISKAAFRPIPMVVPPASVVQAFAQAAQGWHDQIVANVRQSRQLAALRDALLPQLLSGEIRLREAERAVGDSLHATGTPRRGDGITLPRTGKATGTTKGRA